MRFYLRYNLYMQRLLLLASFLLYCAFARSQTTYYVDAARPDNAGAGTSWASAKKDLQAAINLAGTNASIWVKAGTYLPTHDPFGNASPANNRDKTFLLKNTVKIYGGFAGTETQLNQRNPVTNITILSGDLGVANTLTDNAYHVVLSVNLSNTSVLDGFTVTKGYATAPWQSSITVSTRVIDRYKGAGIYNTNSSTTFSNCIVTGNSADCTDTNDDAWGAGMVNYLSSSAITDCRFDGNSFLNGGASFGVFGAGIFIEGGANVLTRCYIVNNTSGSGFLDASRGGGLYLGSGSSSLVNCVFYNNSAQNGAAICGGGGEFNVSTITNCSFVNNTSSFAGTSFVGFADAVFTNCIFWNNAPTSSSVAGRNEIYSQETRVQYLPTFNNCIIRDASGSPLTVTNTVTSGVLNGNPQFIILADGDGPDNRWGTGDDGIRLQCGSPAINAGIGASPLTDILGLSRPSAIDLGAYEGEHANSPVNPLPSAATTVQLGVNPTGINYFSNCSSLVGAVQSGTPYTINGTVTAKVWIENVQPPQYVKRHYEINPQLNAGSATARITLYFRQQDFNDFNAVNTVKLPAGPTDAAGIANIQIEKRGGSSSNGTGLPESYTGPIQTISNASISKVWNAAASRWEISFDVSGFSGFFVKTQLVTLPLRLINFSGQAAGGCTQLNWQTADEVNVKVFVIEKSADGISFVPEGTKASAGDGDHRYGYTDCSFPTGIVYYRLKTVDHDGKFSYSSVIRIQFTGSIVRLFPNPARNSVRLWFNDISLLNTKVRVTDAGGRLILQDVISSQPYLLDISRLIPGVYQLQFSDGTTLLLLKER